MDSKDIGKGIIISAVSYTLIGFVGSIFQVPVFPTGEFATVKLLFAGAYFVIVTGATAILPTFLK